MENATNQSLSLKKIQSNKQDYNIAGHFRLEDLYRVLCSISIKMKWNILMILADSIKKSFLIKTKRLNPHMQQECLTLLRHMRLCSQHNVLVSLSINNCFPSIGLHYPWFFGNCNTSWPTLQSIIWLTNKLSLFAVSKLITHTHTCSQSVHRPTLYIL